MSSRPVISGIDGASRMSSVSGLKVRPSTATVLPRRAAEDVRHLARHRALSDVVDAEHRFDDAQLHVMVLRGLDQRARVLGKAGAANSPGRHAGT